MRSPNVFLRRVFFVRSNLGSKLAQGFEAGTSATLLEKQIEKET